MWKVEEMSLREDGRLDFEQKEMSFSSLYARLRLRFCIRMKSAIHLSLSLFSCL